MESGQRRTDRRQWDPDRQRRRIRNLVIINAVIYVAAAYVIAYTVRDLANVEMPVPMPPRISSILVSPEERDEASPARGLEDLPEPGEYVPAEPPLPMPSLPPPPTIDPVKAQDLRSSLEAVGLYIAAGLESRAREIRVGATEIPQRIANLGRERPESPYDLTMRITWDSKKRVACLKGSAPEGGTWYYLYPPGNLTTQRLAARCP